MSLAPSPAPQRPLPTPTRESQPYWDGMREGKLMLQHCAACGKVRHYPRPVCPHCFSMKWEWALMSGRGVLHNYVVMHKAWTKWFESRVPYAVVQVELEEGARLTTNLLECDLKDIKIGMPVEACYEDISPEITLLQFRPVKR